MKNFKNVILLSLLLTGSSFARVGSEGGGGGDSDEMRVDEIRGDILNWINKGGSKGLQLPEGINLREYNSKMSYFLSPQVVVVGFIDDADEVSSQLGVSVDGVLKTCRGYFSDDNAIPHILCDKQRFRETSESGQYKLIHHEYAGLANLEDNKGAASDYYISSQLTDYLVPMNILRLSILASADREPDSIFRTVIGVFPSARISFNKACDLAIKDAEVKADRACQEEGYQSHVDGFTQRCSISRWIFSKGKTKVEYHFTCI